MFRRSIHLALGVAVCINANAAVVGNPSTPHGVSHERAKSELARIQDELRAAKSRPTNTPAQAARLQKLERRIGKLASKLEGDKHTPSDESEISAELLEVTDLLREDTWQAPMRDELGREVETVGGASEIRGLGLFQTDALRSRVQDVLNVIDELPAMEGYEPSDDSEEEERERIGDGELEKVLAELSRSADALSAEIGRLGRSPSEQDMTFFGGSQAAGQEPAAKPTAPDHWLGRLDSAIAALEADRSKIASAGRSNDELIARTDALLIAAKRVRAAVSARALSARPPTIPY